MWMFFFSQTVQEDLCPLAATVARFSFKWAIHPDPDCFSQISPQAFSLLLLLCFLVPYESTPTLLKFFSHDNSFPSDVQASFTFHLLLQLVSLIYRLLNPRAINKTKVFYQVSFQQMSIKKNLLKPDSWKLFLSSSRIFFKYISEKQKKKLNF